MDDLVKQAREVLEGTTPAPWEWDDENTQMLCLGGFVIDYVYGEGMYASAFDDDRANTANMTFMAKARALVPTMADRIEALTAERDALAEKLAEYQDDYGDLPNPAYLRGHNDGRNSKAPTDAEWIVAESVAIDAIKAERDALAKQVEELKHAEVMRRLADR